MYLDTEGQIIGSGEDTVVKLLSEMFDLPILSRKEFVEKRDGIYRNIKIPLLLNDEYNQDLSSEHANSSVDVVVIINGEILAVRVQGGGSTKQGKGGHYSDGKAKFDSVQRGMLEKSGITVCNIWKHNCPNIFKDRLNDKSMEELLDSLVTTM